MCWSVYIKVVRTFEMKNTENIDPIDELNETQQTRLQESILQSKDGQIISDEASKQRISEKLTNEDATLTHFDSQKVLAKDWLSPIEDEVWQDL